MNKSLIAVAIALAIIVSACGQSAPPAGGGPGMQMPPPEVGVVKASPETVALVTELPGRLEAVRIAQVRARVPGIVQKRLFREGSDVKAGQVLYQLDPASYRAALDSAQAAVARSEAVLAQAGATVDRYRPLVEANAISRQDYVNAQAAQKQAAADLAAGRAAVQTARINLGYATVTAPISGRIGRTLVTEGALVGQGEATQLTTIQQIDPLYVNFTQSVSDLTRLRAAFDSGRLKRIDGAQGAEVKVLLDDGSVFKETGRLLFSDLTVDQASGQVTLRAELPNPGAVLLPGMYVRVRIEQAQFDSAILLPQQAVTRGVAGDSVMVVDDKGNVAPRQVKLGNAQGNRWVVLEGLQTGEMVVVDGFQKMRPGVPVKPVAWTPPAPGGASAGGPPAGWPAAGSPAAAGKDAKEGGKAGAPGGQAAAADAGGPAKDGARKDGAASAAAK